eukprot:1819717-Rhodomonas_salina.1
MPEGAAWKAQEALQLCRGEGGGLYPGHGADALERVDEVLDGARRERERRGCAVGAVTVDHCIDVRRDGAGLVLALEEVPEVRLHQARRGGHDLVEGVVEVHVGDETAPAVVVAFAGVDGEGCRLELFLEERRSLLQGRAGTAKRVGQPPALRELHLREGWRGREQGVVSSGWNVSSEAGQGDEGGRACQPPAQGGVVVGKRECTSRGHNRGGKWGSAGGAATVA